MTALRKFAYWVIPALTTALTAAFFYLLSGRSHSLIQPAALHGTPPVTILAILIILLAPAGVLTYAILAHRAERIARTPGHSTEQW